MFSAGNVKVMLKLCCFCYYCCYCYHHHHTIWMSLVTGLSFLILLLNQRWSPPLRLQASHCSTFRIMCDVPSTAVCCGSTECIPVIASKSFFTPFVTIPVAPIITGIIIHFIFHIRCVSIHKLLDLFSFCFLLSDISVSKYCHMYHCAWFLFFPFNYYIWPSITLFIIIIIIIIIIAFYAYHISILQKVTQVPHKGSCWDCIAPVVLWIDSPATRQASETLEEVLQSPSPLPTSTFKNNTLFSLWNASYSSLCLSTLAVCPTRNTFISVPLGFQGQPGKNHDYSVVQGPKNVTKCVWIPSVYRECTSAKIRVLDLTILRGGRKFKFGTKIYKLLEAS